MATITLEFKAPPDKATVVITLEEDDLEDILAAFAASVPQIEDAGDLLKYFASNISSQIQGITQNYRQQQTPAEVPPVTIE